jgi:hypothetical protein
MAGKTTIDILALSKELTAEHLETVRGEIARVEKELHGLRVTEKFIEEHLNGPKERKKPGKKPGGNPSPTKGDDDDDDDDRPLTANDRHKEIALLLLAAGKMRVAMIAERLKMSPPPVYSLINHPWFIKDAAGEVSLTAEGRTAAMAAKK